MRKRCLKRWVAGVAAAFVTAGVAPRVSAAPIRNVILMVGDGMGAGQVAAARCYAGEGLVFEAFPFRGEVATLTAQTGVTDSAAAATALATGRKASVEVVSLAIPGDGAELETLLERAQRLDKSAGLVTSSYLTDATPAAFGAHNSNRWNHAAIAADYLWRSRPNVLLGGGGNGLSAADAGAAGYHVVTDAAGLAALSRRRPSRVAGLFGYGPMPFEADSAGGLPGLAAMTEAALGLLAADPDGFFLLVEGGRIDHACHGNDVWRCVTETLAFEAAVRVVTAWAAGRGDTLVLVTADHETGGLQVVADRGAGSLPDVAWSTVWHTDAPVAVYATGANAALAAAATENTHLHGVACSEAPMPATGCGVERVSANVTRSYWAVSSGDVCRLAYTPTLSPPVWRPCGVVTSVGTRVCFETTNGPAASSGFYRLGASADEGP